MNQTIKVTMYSPVHEALGEREHIVTGLKFNKESGWVTFQLSDTTFDVSLENLTAEGRHDSVPNQILSKLKEDDMTVEEKAIRRDIRHRIDYIVQFRATESWVASRGERGL